MTIFVRIILAALASSILAACTGSGGGSGSDGSGGGQSGQPPGSTPPTNNVTAATVLETQNEASRFLIQASLGEPMSGVDALVGVDAASWLSAQFAEPPTRFLPRLLARRDNGEDLGRTAHSPLFWDALLTADDVLRLRMVFALSQLLVVSDRGFNDPLEMAYYIDVLVDNAFGNYRDLLEAVTYSPAMADYLTYRGNRKGDPATGRLPDENYARELLQLFTIGLVELNSDGSSRLDADNQPIPSYDNDDIEGLARVFTGFNLKGPTFRSSDPDARYSPIQLYPDEHSTLEKSFLGQTISANTPGDASVSEALDIIFNHPNVAPFVSRQLIQRFTASNPQPAYVARVATAFENGRFVAPDGTVFGDSNRGDLQATLAAILLDPSVHETAATPGLSDGKIREPILKFVHWARAFRLANVQSVQQRRLNDTSASNDRLGQHPFRSPSVFNFYRPGYIAPGFESGEAGMTTPEFQIVNASSALGFTDFMTLFVFDRSPDTAGDDPSFTPNYSDEIPLADDPAALVDRLDMLLTGGRMLASVRQSIISAVTAVPIDEDDPDPDRLRRVRIAVLMALTSPSFGASL